MAAGSTVSLALGALSYYLWALSVGGEAKEKMLQLDPEVWADQAINRSGVLAIFADAQEFASSVPFVRDRVTFSGERITKRGSDLWESIAGPTFGDLGPTAANVMTGFDQPTQGWLHQLRLLTPYQNHFLLRQFYEAMEEGPGKNLPERRQ